MNTLIHSLLCLLLSMSSSYAWDFTGHMIVDQIAWENLKPAAREKVTKLAAELDRTYNAERPYNAITIGCWMDDMRALPGYAQGKWHYIDIPYTPHGLNFEEPKPPHALWAIEQSLATLRKLDAPSQEQADALGVLTHVVGDIHMPLHCANRDDHGGNAFEVRGVTIEGLPEKMRPTLHIYWDGSYRYDARGGPPGQVYPGLDHPDVRPDKTDSGFVFEQAKMIMQKFPSEDLHQLAAAGSDVRQWIRESHHLACVYVYPPSSYPPRGRKVTLTPEYMIKAREISESRIALAGYRLAAVLNELFASSTPAP